MKAGFGSLEAQERIQEVHKTQKAIKKVLVERWDAWEDARALALEDPDVQITARGIEYHPSDHSSGLGDVTDNAATQKTGQTQDTQPEQRL
jgi:large subunit ribosomal protein L47